MSGKFTISILMVLLISTVSALPAAGSSKKAKPLPDGFVLAGVDGKLTGPDANNVWLFEFDSDVSDAAGHLRAGTRLELLPSAALEKMTADVKKHTDVNYRLWGRIAKYRGENFIFPVYFLLLKEAEQPKPSNSEQTRRKLTINEPDDALAIPQEVLDRLQTRRGVRPEQLRKGLELKTDFILAGRTGIISSCVMPGASCVKGKNQGTQYDTFSFDALGRGLQRGCFRLLPCQALERAQMIQLSEPEPLRFKVSGIVTKYKGSDYLLLQRAVRAYSHGNFGR